MPRISTIRLNLVDVMLLIMMIIGIVIAIHTILLAVIQPTPMIPKPVVVILPKPIGLIAP